MMGTQRRVRNPDIASTPFTRVSPHRNVILPLGVLVVCLIRAPIASMSSGDLTTTSYALLTLLAVRSWTTYELAKQMRRNYHWFWPRAESKLYEEPKKLVALGLATATVDLVGRRPRTTYAITSAGREALAR